MIRQVPDLATVRIALVGVPNCGKTALFNRLTGSHQKVANYPGVTVERKEGSLHSPDHRRVFQVIDLPGTYSLVPASLDEAITRDVLVGRLAGEKRPELVVCVLDATNLRLSLRLALEVKRTGVAMIAALNMSDLAHRRGCRLDRARLEAELGVPVVETIAVRHGGEAELVKALLTAAEYLVPATVSVVATTPAQIEATQAEVRRILELAGYREPLRSRALARLDAIVMNPIAGPVMLAALLFCVFQAVFSWAEAPMNWIDAGVGWVGAGLRALLPPGPLQSLLVDGLVAGVGSVLVFMPQILILFFFILILEESGYLPRAAFLLDRIMGTAGLSGRAFMPLLSSFACAIPGIMATRTIQNPRDRMVTIMIAPLMTCSARLPVYAVIIAAFIPDRDVHGLFNLQGIVLFCLYVAGVASAMLVAFIVKRTAGRGRPPLLMMELPDYHWPNLRSLAFGLWERAKIFLTRVGTIILSLMIILWFLSTFPGPPPGASEPAIYYSFAGMLGHLLEPVFRPIGFNWQICVALVPGLAAREVAVGALGTVYALSQSGDQLAQSLIPLIAQSWTLPTALSLLAWYVFAPQCISTLSVVRRETNSWRYPLLMAGYLFALAYLASFATYRVAMSFVGAAP
jgi:ferrous iron transport protein B